MRSEAHVEKFLLLPFSFGCESKASVATASTATNSAKNEQLKLSVGNGERKKPSSSVKEKRKLEPLSSSVSRALHRLIKRIFRRLSQIFVYEEEIEAEEKEMEIGLPTDVKHVTHIGLDGVTRINNSLSAENTSTSQLQIPSISVEQFELAMAAQSRRSSTAPESN